MELDIIQTKTTWNDAAGSINSNYAKIADAIAQLKANGGGGGGGADIDLTDYATKVWVEANYAPLTSVQGFENRIGGLESAVPQLNARVETVESKVATLNEYVVTGGNNLLNRVNVIEQEYATKTYVDNAIDGIDISAYLLKADLTKSRIQSTLGISDWALAATKPSYAWSEITSRPTALSQFTDDVVAGKYLRATIYGSFDADTLFNDGSHSGPMSHLPSGSPYGIVHTLSYRGVSNNAKPDYAAQIFIPCGDDSTSPNDMFFRTSLADSWNGWTRVLTNRNYTEYIPTKLSQLTDDVVAGKYLPLSKFQVAEVADPSTVYLQSGIYRHSDYGSGGTMGWSQFITLFAGGDNWAQMYFSFNGRLHYRVATFTDGAPENIPWIDIITEKNIGDYNAGSATKLQTPRTLWGQRFDGTGDVSGTFRQLYTGSYDGAVAHSILCNINGPYGLITRINSNGNVLQQAQRETTEVEWFNFILQPFGGNVGIGNTSPTERLDVSGNVKASGNINATSITINGVTITASNGSITVNGNVFATGAITAKAVG